MNDDDRLQERLARLEAEEPLESCQAGLSDEEAGMLQMAAQFRSIQFPGRSENAVAAQRADLLKAATQRKAKTRPRHENTPSFRALLSRWRAALPAPVGLALAGVILIAAVAGAVFLRQPAQPTDVALNPDAPAGALPAPAATRFALYVPMVSAVLSAPDPQSAVISESRGIVQMQTEDDTWTTIKVGQVVQAGQRLRTSDLSSAMLLFYDGSRAQLGPVTEASVDELDAAADGPRVVRLTQWAGETDHDVTPSSNPASRYEVRTPSGTASAKGTAFHVSLSVTLIMRVSVDEGSVAASSLNVTVIVSAGQVTTIQAGAPPDQPTFRVTGEGVVTQIGEAWRIGGLEFLTDEHTVIVGDPQIGDRVFVDGHLLADGTRLADRIVLLSRAPENRFAFTGTVEAIGDAEWTISGRAVDVNEETDIDEGIEVGDVAAVDGTVRPDGTLLAKHIRRVEDPVGLPFEFIGLVETLSDEMWTISGASIAVDADTEIEAGLDVGDVVKVEGHILADGIWLAKEIKRAEEHEHEFEFTGVVQSIDPWIVSGIGFDTDSQTEIDEGIQVGDRVKVEGRILDDGSWLAREIKRLNEQPARFELVGRVDDIDPWIVSGVAIAADDDTEIDADLEVGDLVRVRGRVLPDGTLLAEEIKRLDQVPICIEIRAVISSINGSRIVLNDGQIVEVSDAVAVTGNLEVGAVIIVRICVRLDGTLIVVSIEVILEPAPPSPTPPPPGSGETVNICHKPDKKGEGHTLTIPQSALAGHLGHGDTLGACRDHDDDDNRNDNGNHNGHDDDDD